MEDLKCTECGKEIPPGEKTCPACGGVGENKKSYGKTVLGIMTAIIIVIVGYYLFSPEKPIEVEPSALLTYYVEDTKGADAKYKGKLIKTTGMISVGDNLPGLPSFVIILGIDQDKKTGGYGALVVTAEKYKNDTAFMNSVKDHEDGYATVEGKCLGRMDTDVTINGHESCIVQVEMEKISY